MWWEIPGHLESRDGKLYIGERPAEELANWYGTPLHVYNGDRIAANFRRFQSTLSEHNPSREIRVHYAMKTNSNEGVLKLLKNEDSWIDAVSPGEANFAAFVGYGPENILFTGSSVSDESMEDILRVGARMNVDSPSQLHRLDEILKNQNILGYGISIRVDPGITGAGHVPENITTGSVTIYGEKVPTKFGVDRADIDDLIEYVRDSERLRLRGLHFHIGSNWRTEPEIQAFLQNLGAALVKSKEAVKTLGYDLEFIDLGGGPGVRYREEHSEFPLERYAHELSERVNASGLDLKALAFEPGRYISADAGILLTRVVDIKYKDGKLVIGVDTGFNHIPRPEVYNSHHEAVLCNKADAEPTEYVMIAGNVCETGDYLTRDPIERHMPLPKEGDVIAFLTTGAYVKAMEMKGYNMWQPAQELLIADGLPAYLFKERISRTTVPL